MKRLIALACLALAGCHHKQPPEVLPRSNQIHLPPPEGLSPEEWGRQASEAVEAFYRRQNEKQ